MKITIESTTKMVTLDGVPARVWEGTTESGLPVHAFITRIGTPAANVTEFERELERCVTPSPDVALYPGRMIL